jgi:hypothetical protein
MEEVASDIDPEMSGEAARRPASRAESSGSAKRARLDSVDGHDDPQQHSTETAQPPALALSAESELVFQDGLSPSSEEVPDGDELPSRPVCSPLTVQEFCAMFEREAQFYSHLRAPITAETGDCVCFADDENVWRIGRLRTVFSVLGLLLSTL